MNWSWKILSLLLFLVILLGLSSLILFNLYRTSTNLEHETALLSTQLRNSIFSQVENAARFLSRLNSSASTLANILSSSIPVNGTDELSFNLIEQKVAPWLLVAFSTIPHVSHASYVGKDGLMFSYTINHAGIFATFSNSSSSCYTQPVDGDSGELSGQAVRCGPLGGREKGLVFVYNAALGGKGLITLAYPTKVVADHFAHLALHNGDLHLATRDGRPLLETKLNDTRVYVRNGTASVEAVDVNGDVEEKTGFYSCNKADDGELPHFLLKIRGIQRIFYCSTLEIGGIQSVYVISFPTRGVESSAHKKRIKAFVLVLAVLVVTFIMIMRSARQELVLGAALAKQMEVERKSLSKRVAFASASHDIRTSLVAMSGLIDLCRATAKPESELAANLGQMSTCAVDLLGILNSVLDTSKIEAGKMQLEEEEFNIAELVEDVVDLFYPLSMKKGVDIVLDPTDCSIFKFSLVKGDRAKLKQILCNLLSNATKFTSQGHISVRAMVRKRNQITRVEDDDESMDYIFEVDDTGEGIPKEMRALVFDNFVQVKETALGQGTGLGLGIIQSLVRLMGGEIKIVDKDEGERGSCFRFNVVLTACQGTHVSNDGYPTRCFGMSSLASRSDASHVILFLAGNERRKVTENLIRRLGLRVSIVKTSSDLVHVLDSYYKNLSESNNETCGTESNSILVVLDANAAPISELCSVLRERIHKLQCEIVWVENPMKRKESEERDDEKRTPACHHILSRPLHGSHLHRILQLLPEFRPSSSRDEKIHSSSQEATSLPNEIEVVVVSENDEKGSSKALNGKNVLLVEDDRTLCMLATKILEKLGATLHVCRNGKEAFDLVCTTLKNKDSLPFEYIFMDCKMPFMDGFEATRLIRKEEEAYGIHTPIIALTAYSEPEEVNRAMDAGMDFHLLKPLDIQNVLHLIHR